MKLEDEAVLVAKAKHDSKAFSSLYDAYYTPIYRYVLHRTLDVPVALDLTSNVFVKALDSMKKYTWREIPFSSWLYKIAGNEVAEYYRGKRKAAISLEQLMEKYDFEPASMTDLQAEIIEAEDALQKNTVFVKLYAELNQLDMIYQEVLSLRYLEKKKIKEIAVILGRSEGTVKSQLSRGIALLQKKIGSQNAHEDHVTQPIPAVSVIQIGKTYEKS